jgi:Rap1a immunity proteins
MIGLLMMLAAADNSFLAFETGNQLYSRCQQDRRGSCTAFVVGVSDTIETVQSDVGRKAVICKDEGVTKSQITDVVIKHLSDHPETRHDAAARIVILALSKAFPCPK